MIFESMNIGAAFGRKPKKVARPQNICNSKNMSLLLAIAGAIHVTVANG